MVHSAATASGRKPALGRSCDAVSVLPDNDVRDFIDKGNVARITR
jgi:hypothetical protein